MNADGTFNHTTVRQTEDNRTPAPIQREAGLKYSPAAFDGPFTAAICDLRQTNLTHPVSEEIGGIVVGGLRRIGEAKSRGLDLSAIATVAEGRDVQTGHAYNDTRQWEGDNTGNALPNATRHLVGDVRFRQRHPRRRRHPPSGQTVRGQGQNPGSGPPLMDLRASHTRGNLEGSLDVSNLTQRERRATVPGPAPAGVAGGFGGLLDEPTTFLGISHQVEVPDPLTDLNHRRGTKVVMVLRDLNMAARHADQLVAMANGSLHARATPKAVLTGNRVRAVFGRDRRIIPVPPSGRPMMLPIGRHRMAERQGVPGQKSLPCGEIPPVVAVNSFVEHRFVITRSCFPSGVCHPEQRTVRCPRHSIGYILAKAPPSWTRGKAIQPPAAQPT